MCRGYFSFQIFLSRLYFLVVGGVSVVMGTLNVLCDGVIDSLRAFSLIKYALERQLCSILVLWHVISDMLSYLVIG